MKKIKPKICVKAKKLLYDWKDKKNFLVHYRMLEFYVRRCMKVDKIHGLIPVKQSIWLEKYINFNTKKQKKGKK